MAAPGLGDFQRMSGLRRQGAQPQAIAPTKGCQQSIALMPKAARKNSQWRVVHEVSFWHLLMVADVVVMQTLLTLPMFCVFIVLHTHQTHATHQRWVWSIPRY
jgi:hypothetical protein